MSSTNAWLRHRGSITTTAGWLGLRHNGSITTTAAWLRRRGFITTTAVVLRHRGSITTTAVALRRPHNVIIVAYRLAPVCAKPVRHASACVWRPGQVRGALGRMADYANTV